MLFPRLPAFLLTGLLACTVPASLRSTNPGELKWVFTTAAPVLSSPAIAENGDVLFGSDDFGVYRVDRNGVLEWVFLTLDWVHSRPAIGADGSIYVTGWDGFCHQITADGLPGWTYLTGDFIVSSPTLSSQGIIHFGSGDAFLHAVGQDGFAQWTFEAEDWIDSSPALGPDNAVYFGSWDGYLYALEPDGSLRWSFDSGEVIVSSPALGPDGTVYIGSGDRLLAVKADGTLAWDFTTDGLVDTTPLVRSDGSIVFGSGDGGLYAVSGDGQLLWRYEAEGPVFSSPALGPTGILYVGSDDGHLHAVRPDGSPHWKLLTGDLVESSPAVGIDGTVYVGSWDGALYAVAGDAPPVLLGDPPLPTTMAPGAPLVLIQEVGGSPAPQLQWYRNGQPIPGETADTLVIDEAAAVHSGAYRLRAENEHGILWTDPVEVTVTAPPVIALQPQPALVPEGADVTLVILAQGAGPLTYTWTRNGQLIPGVEGSELFLPAGPGQPGTYRAIIANPYGEVLSQSVTVAQTHPGALPVNVSTRGFVGEGGDMLIAGLVLQGPGRGRVLLRGIGPGLGEFLPHEMLLAKPELVLRDHQGQLVEANQAWQDHPRAAEIAATDFSPSHPADTAILRDLEAGIYTVWLRGRDGDTGLGIVEAYVLESLEGFNTGPRPVNLSTRGLTGPGASTLIAGFVVTGNHPRTVLLRGVGPGLKAFFPEHQHELLLAEPRLTLFDADAVELDHNEGSWLDHARAEEIAATPFPPNDPGDTAILTDVEPGVYTVWLRGPPQTWGLGLIELYVIDP
ncbi:MAG: hypothetical protein EA425_09240 [Puniceicoccaceae bacterium]|nr:MAG: hypothetical protein EA425_09240 [Puniceicoccaceae bacterium]